MSLLRYIGEVQAQCISEPLKFWVRQEHTFPLLNIKFLAEDLVAAPSPEAFVERIFSWTGLISAVFRNRMKNSLGMRVFMKLSGNILNW